MSSSNTSSCSNIRITADNARYCYLDIDVYEQRQKLALAAAFCNATDARYGFSSPNLLELGGSELKRLPDLFATDHEWKDKGINTPNVDRNDDNDDTSSIAVKPPSGFGNRIILQLDWETAPLACENFATLCSNGGGDRSFLGASKNKEKKIPPAPVGDSGKPLTYRGSQIHRVVPGFILQGGDFVFGNGSGGESVFGKAKFKDERAGLMQKHDGPSILSMGNSGKNSNTSQFFVTLAPAPQCDGKHVVFGKVISGFALLQQIEQLAQKDEWASEVPPHAISISDCGIWTPLLTPAAGYWYDKPDPESFSGVSPLFMTRPRVALVVPNAAAAEKFTKSLSSFGVVVYASSSAEDNEGESRADSTAIRIQTDWLGAFRADVVLVAPACKEVLQQITSLPESWTAQQQQLPAEISLEQVVMEAKPVDALKKVLQESWLANQRQQHWQLDGSALM